MLVMPLSEADLQYYAGFFDGEGSISLIKQRANNFRGYRFRVEVGVGQVHGWILEPLAKMFGGSSWYQRKHSSTTNGRPLLQIRWFSLQSLELLRTLGPYLRLKKRHAEFAIEAQEILSSLRGGRGHGKASPKRLWEIYWELKRLNKRGLK